MVDIQLHTPTVMYNEVGEGEGAEANVIAFGGVNKCFNVRAVTSHCTGEGRIHECQYHGIHHEDHGYPGMQAVTCHKISNRIDDSKEKAAAW